MGWYSFCCWFSSLNFTRRQHEHLLLLGFHPAVLAELAAPAKEVGWQEDWGEETGLLYHLVSLLQVSLHHRVCEAGESQTWKLKHQDITLNLTWSQFQTYLADSTAESLSPVEDSSMVGRLLPRHLAWAGTEPDLGPLFNWWLVMMRGAFHSENIPHIYNFFWLEIK